MKEHFIISPDISEAQTLPADFYKDDTVFESLKSKVFKKFWHIASDIDSVKVTGDVHPFTLYPGFMDEPVILTRDNNDKLHCLSNVCTHRASLLVSGHTNMKDIKCPYHGRRFELNGKFKRMPEFDHCKNFPTEADNLQELPIAQWHNLLFCSFEPVVSLEQLLKPITERMKFFPFEQLVFNEQSSREYLVKAHWSLYVENYLEGFHIPFVHTGLNDVLDYGSYQTELYEYSNLQLGIAKGEQCFKLPSDSPDYGKDVAAYYFWVFPNLMLNFYPWGLSINIIKPVNKQLTKIQYLTYVSDESKVEQGAGAGLDRVEREDEYIVEMVQKGINSSFYDKGRYSPTREQGVHHYHSLMAKMLG